MYRIRTIPNSTAVLRWRWLRLYFVSQGGSARLGPALYVYNYHLSNVNQVFGNYLSERRETTVPSLSHRPGTNISINSPDAGPRLLNDSDY